MVILSTTPSGARSHWIAERFSVQISRSVYKVVISELPTIQTQHQSRTLRRFRGVIRSDGLKMDGYGVPGGRRSDHVKDSVFPVHSKCLPNGNLRIGDHPTRARDWASSLS
jgi:hypothetical protein